MGPVESGYRGRPQLWDSFDTRQEERDVQFPPLVPLQQQKVPGSDAEDSPEIDIVGTTEVESYGGTEDGTEETGASPPNHGLPEGNRADGNTARPPATFRDAEPSSEEDGSEEEPSSSGPRGEPQGARQNHSGRAEAAAAQLPHRFEGSGKGDGDGRARSETPDSQDSFGASPFVQIKGAYSPEAAWAAAAELAADVARASSSPRQLTPDSAPPPLQPLEAAAGPSGADATAERYTSEQKGKQPAAGGAGDPAPPPGGPAPPPGGLVGDRWDLPGGTLSATGENSLMLSEYGQQQYTVCQPENDDSSLSEQCSREEDGDSEQADDPRDADFEVGAGASDRAAGDNAQQQLQQYSWPSRAEMRKPPRHKKRQNRGNVAGLSAHARMRDLLKEVLDALNKRVHKDRRYAFMEQVNQLLVSDYCKHVKAEDEVWLSLIRKKVNDGRHSSLASMLKDFEQLLANARAYNTPGSGQIASPYLITDAEEIVRVVREEGEHRAARFAELEALVADEAARGLTLVSYRPAARAAIVLPTGFEVRQVVSAAKPRGYIEYVAACPIHGAGKRLDRWKEVADFLRAHHGCREEWAEWAQHEGEGEEQYYLRVRETFHFKRKEMPQNMIRKVQVMGHYGSQRALGNSSGPSRSSSSMGTAPRVEQPRAWNAPADAPVRTATLTKIRESLARMRDAFPARSYPPEAELEEILYEGARTEAEYSREDDFEERLLRAIGRARQRSHALGGSASTPMSPTSAHRSMVNNCDILLSAANLVDESVQAATSASDTPAVPEHTEAPQTAAAAATSAAAGLPSGGSGGFQGGPSGIAIGIPVAGSIPATRGDLRGDPGATAGHRMPEPVPSQAPAPGGSSYAQPMQHYWKALNGAPPSTGAVQTDADGAARYPVIIPVTRAPPALHVPPQSSQPAAQPTHCPAQARPVAQPEGAGTARLLLIPHATGRTAPGPSLQPQPPAQPPAQQTGQQTGEQGDDSAPAQQSAQRPRIHYFLNQSRPQQPPPSQQQQHQFRPPPPPPPPSPSQQQQQVSAHPAQAASPQVSMQRQTLQAQTPPPQPQPFVPEQPLQTGGIAHAAAANVSAPAGPVSIVKASQEATFASLHLRKPPPKPQAPFQAGPAWDLPPDQASEAAQKQATMQHMMAPAAVLPPVLQASVPRTIPAGPPVTTGARLKSVPPAPPALPAATADSQQLPPEAPQGNPPASGSLPMRISSTHTNAGASNNKTAIPSHRSAVLWGPQQQQQQPISAPAPSATASQAAAGQSMHQRAASLGKQTAAGQPLHQWAAAFGDPTAAGQSLQQRAGSWVGQSAAVQEQPLQGTVTGHPVPGVPSTQWSTLTVNTGRAPNQAQGSHAIGSARSGSLQPLTALMPQLSPRHAAAPAPAAGVSPFLQQPPGNPTAPSLVLLNPGGGASSPRMSLQRLEDLASTKTLAAVNVMKDALEAAKAIEAENAQLQTEVVRLQSLLHESNLREGRLCRDAAAAARIAEEAAARQAAEQEAAAREKAALMLQLAQLRTAVAHLESRLVTLAQGANAGGSARMLPDQADQHRSGTPPSADAAAAQPQQQRATSAPAGIAPDQGQESLNDEDVNRAIAAALGRTPPATSAGENRTIPLPLIPSTTAAVSSAVANCSEARGIKRSPAGEVEGADPKRSRGEDGGWSGEMQRENSGTERGESTAAVCEVIDLCLSPEEPRSAERGSRSGE